MIPRSKLLMAGVLPKVVPSSPMSKPVMLSPRPMLRKMVKHQLRPPLKRLSQKTTVSLTPITSLNWRRREPHLLLLSLKLASQTASLTRSGPTPRLSPKRKKTLSLELVARPSVNVNVLKSKSLRLINVMLNPPNVVVEEVSVEAVDVVMDHHVATEEVSEDVVRADVDALAAIVAHHAKVPQETEVPQHPSRLRTNPLSQALAHKFHHRN